MGEKTMTTHQTQQQDENVELDFLGPNFLDGITIDYTPKDYKEIVWPRDKRGLRSWTRRRAS